MTELDYIPKKTAPIVWILIIGVTFGLLIAACIYVMGHSEPNIIRNGGNSAWHIDDTWIVDHSEIPFPYINMDRINTNSGSVRFKSHGKLK